MIGSHWNFKLLLRTFYSFFIANSVVKRQNYRRGDQKNNFYIPQTARSYFLEEQRKEFFTAQVEKSQST